MNRAFAAVLLAAAFVTPSLAHADTTDFVVSTTAGGIASAATFTAIDVVADPSAKLYGVTEAVVNGAFVVTGAINLATMEGDRVDGARAVVTGVALWNAVLAVHGVYVATREGPEPAPAPGVAFEVGHARGALTPTAVTDGSLVGAGLGVFGSF